MAKRNYGSGELYEKHGKWYGRWHLPAGNKANRLVGEKKPHPDGLTRLQAERKLQRMIAGEGTAAVVMDAGRTVEHVGDLALSRLRAMKRKPSHISSFESHKRVHIDPYFAGRALDSVNGAECDRFQAHLLKKKTHRGGTALAPKTVANIMGTLHTIFDYGLDPKRRWITENPCRLVDKPDVDRDADGEIHFLTPDELEAVLRAIPLNQGKRVLSWEQIDYVRRSGESNLTLAKELDVSDSLLSRIRRGLIYDVADREVDELRELIDETIVLVAAWTGLRQGELRGLRWKDVGWFEARLRVRQSFVRGEFGKPKSKRSARGVPLADRAAVALELLSQRSPYNGDGDLVFANPTTGNPIDGSRLTKRLKRYCAAAGVAEIRFHDLRHTFGTSMAAGNVPMRTLQEWFGHADVRTTQIYADYSPSPEEAAMVTTAMAAARRRRADAAEVA